MLLNWCVMIKAPALMQNWHWLFLIPSRSKQIPYRTTGAVNLLPARYPSFLVQIPNQLPKGRHHSMAQWAQARKAIYIFEAIEENKVKINKIINKNK